jgi:hypothetical protein
MRWRVRCAVALVVLVGLSSLLLPVVVARVPALARVVPVARYGPAIVFPASLILLMVILHGHGTGCPKCARWWTRRRVEAEFVDREVFEKKGVPFARSTYRTTYACDSCGHRWSVISTEEYRESVRDRTRTPTRLG